MHNSAYEYPIGYSFKQEGFDTRYYDPVSATIAALTIGATAYSAQQQKKAAKDASEAQRKAEMEARRIAAEKKPLEESATLTSPIDDPSKMLSQLNLLVEPQQRGKSAVGFGSMSQSKLGFGG